MKKYTQHTTLKSLITAFAALGFIAVPAVLAEEERVVIKTDRVPLKAEVDAAFVDGYTVPN